jgi:hypothetical protein
MAKDAPAQTAPAMSAAPPDALFKAQVRLDGDVGDEMFRAFRDGFDKACAGPDPVVVELTTFGGDADVARRIAGDVRLFRERTGRPVLFFGRTVVYSAGTVIMGGFAREDRWLTRDCVLMIHGRRLAKTLELNGPLAVERVRAEALLAEIDMGLKLEREAFRALIDGSEVGEAELVERCQRRWYLDAPEALKRGLVAGVV